MEFSGTSTVRASPAAIYGALGEPETVAAVLPGCRALEPDAANRARVVARVRIGPLSGEIAGLVKRIESAPPHRLVFAGAAEGPLAGSSRGTARLVLTEASEGTRVDWTVSLTPAARLALVEPAVLETAARRFAQAFAAALEARLSAAPPAPAPPAASAPAPAPPEPAAAQAPEPAPADAPGPAPTPEPPAPEPPATPRPEAREEAPAAAPPDDVLGRTAPSPAPAAAPARPPGTRGGAWAWGVLAFAVVLVLLIAFG